MRNLKLDELIDDYINNAVIQGKATLEGNYKKGNVASKKLIKLHKLMDNDIGLSRHMLDVLLANENINVRIWAAGKALDLNYKTEKSRNILLAISKMREIGILGFNAEMSLKVSERIGEKL